MAAIIAGGFGIVITVNLLLATWRCGGLVEWWSRLLCRKPAVQWLAGRAERQKALGWTAEISRDKNGYLLVRSAGVPAEPRLSLRTTAPGRPETSPADIQRTAGWWAPVSRSARKPAAGRT